MTDLELAREKLPLPELMEVLGFGELAKKSAKSPFRDEKTASFGIYNSDGRWRWKDHGTNEGGDEVDFLGKIRALDNKSAIEEFIRIAGVEKQRSNQPPNGNYSNGSSGPWKKYKQSATEEFIEQIADERMVSQSTVRWMVANNILGADCVQPAFKNGNGAHVRQDDGTWRFIPAGIKVESLTFGNNQAKEVYAFESQWDALAIADIIGNESLDDKLFVVTRGASNGKLVGDHAVGRKVYAFPQNDVAKPGGKIPSEEWMKDVSASCKGSVLRVDTPKAFKDANDWCAEGNATKSDVIKAIRSAIDPSLIGVEIHSFEQLYSYEVKNDDTSLLGDRWVCHGGQLLLVGQSGIGKSSLTVQAALMWAMGLPFMGIKPARPLRSLFIQAENDEGDMAEIVQGVMAFALATAIKEKFTKDQAVQMMVENITFVRVTSQTGEEFIRVLRRLLDEHGPKDLVFGDPLLSYIGDDISQQKVASRFLRELCNPLAFERKFAWVWSHHTGKPSSDSKSRKHWNENDYAYIGLGSSELTNWARAIAVLQTTKHEGIFKLLLAKRGRRAGVVDVNSQPSSTIVIKHADSGIYWEPCELPEDDEDDSGKQGRPKAITKLQEAEIICFAEMWPAGKRGLYAEAAKKFNLHRDVVRRFLVASKAE